MHAGEARTLLGGIGMHPNESMVEAMRDLVRRRLRRLRKRFAKARAGDDAGIHDSRTELRRTRAELELMGRTVFDAELTAALVEDLRNCEKALAGSRDAAVFLEDLRGWIHRYPRERPGLARLLERVERQYDRGADDARRALAKKRVRPIFRRLEALLEHDRYIRLRTARTANPAGAVPELVRHFAHEEIWHRYDAVLAYDAKPTRDPETLHALRSACRFLRFAMEDLEEALPGLKGIAGELRDLQEQIGELHDDYVAIGRIDRWVRREKVDPTPAIARYVDHRKRRMRTMRARFENRWVAVMGQPFMRRVAVAVAAA